MLNHPVLRVVFAHSWHLKSQFLWKMMIGFNLTYILLIITLIPGHSLETGEILSALVPTCIQSHPPLLMQKLLIQVLMRRLLLLRNDS
jgi:hypothetical protein